ncbi:Hsp20/alpha crystallin family protein [Candidatus Uabimicrobium sp. HlEnr_7]|uniref:Hsp20/alpha crystallin family protein n=1 Tax=Candidatus Uabimicrobium helgolandensis TaxID=3095367 RepID=UPI003558DCDF
MFFTKDLHSINNLQEEMSKIFDHLNFQFIQPTTTRSQKNLPVNIQGNKEEAIVSVEAPGVNIDDIEISIDKNILNINVSRKEQEMDSKKYYLKERKIDSWKRAIQLGFDINEEKVDANYKKGILYIHVAKQEQSVPKKIIVKKV